MHAIYRWLLRLCPPDVQRDYGVAIQDMLERRIADARSAGGRHLARVWSRELIALVRFAIHERVRRRPVTRKAHRMDTLWQETRLAARRLLRTPGFSLATVATLALAIGANASIFTVVTRVALNPLPYPDSDRLVVLRHNTPGGTGPIVPLPLGIYYHYRERAPSLESIALYRQEERTLTGVGEAEPITAIAVTPSLASVLRVPPAYGRWFSEDEGKPGAPAVAVLSHSLWSRRYGNDVTIIGQPIVLNGVPTQVIGVMPPSFRFPRPEAAVWVPQQLARPATVGPMNSIGIARRRVGTSEADVRRQLSAAIKELPQAYPGDRAARGFAGAIGLFSDAVSLKEFTIGGTSRTLWFLLGAVGVILLVGCANVANLFLVRSDARQREVAVRRALGAGRAGIVRFFLTESALLSGAGGVLGLGIAIGAIRLLVGLQPANLPRLHEVRVDAMTVVFTAGVSVLGALVFGAIPLVRRTPMAATLHEHGRGNTPTRSRHRARHLLMAGQVALALVLLVSSGLMVRSFQQLMAIDTGFDSASTLTFNIGLPAAEYPTRDATTRAHTAILDRLATISGVTAVSASTCLPLAGACDMAGIAVDGRATPTVEQSTPGLLPPAAALRAVAWNQRRALGLRLRRGRDISRDDVERSLPVAIVNQRFVDAYFPGEDPIGKRVAATGPGASSSQWLTIVGVVADTPMDALNEAQRTPKLFMPLTVADGPETRTPAPGTSNMSYIVRSQRPEELLGTIRATIDRIDPNLALSQVERLQERVDRSAAPMAFTMALLVIAAAVTLLLGLVGIYGVMSYIVTQRTGEIGVRLALGETPSAIAVAIVRQGGLVTLAGIVVGLGAALAGGRLIQALLYDVSPRDPAVFATTTAVLLMVALVACWVPARRASKLSPLEALRPE
jgi:putative ABC transport system permease protein